MAQLPSSKPLSMKAAKIKSASLVYAPEKEQSFDLKAWAQPYRPQPFFQIQRLVFLAQVYEPARLAAFEMALEVIQKQTFDTQLYQEVYEIYSDSSSEGARVPLDTDWVAATETHVREELDKLQSELKDYTVNLMRESIRMGYRDLALFETKCGHFEEAVRYFSQSREYCSTPVHHYDLSMQLITLHILMKRYNPIKTQITKALACLDTPKATKTEEEKNIRVSRLRAIEGFTNLMAGRYEAAAELFAAISEPLPDDSILASQDVARYAVYTGVASFSPLVLKSKIIDNNALRPMIDADPHLRDILQAFYAGHYTRVFEIIEQSDALMSHVDASFAPHLSDIKKTILQRTIVTYTLPYSRIAIPRMSAAFGLSEAEIIEKVKELIKKKGALENYRLDLLSQSIIKKNTNVRDSAYESVFANALQAQTSSQLHLMRSKLLVEKIIVR